MNAGKSKSPIVSKLKFHLSNYVPFPLKVLEYVLPRLFPSHTSYPFDAKINAGALDASLAIQLSAVSMIP